MRFSGKIGQEPFESKILRKHQRRSDTIDETFMKLFIEGLATRDFEPSLRLLVGEDAPLSPSTISRLTQKFREKYAAFEKQDLSERSLVYICSHGGRYSPKRRILLQRTTPSGVVVPAHHRRASEVNRATLVATVRVLTGRVEALPDLRPNAARIFPSIYEVFCYGTN